MGLREDINTAVKDAMKSGDKKRLSTLRLMTAAIKDMGKVMAELKANYAGQMDFAKADGIVKSLLG